MCCVCLRDIWKTKAPLPRTVTCSPATFYALKQFISTSDHFPTPNSIHHRVQCTNTLKLMFIVIQP